MKEQSSRSASLLVVVSVVSSCGCCAFVYKINEIASLKSLSCLHRFMWLLCNKDFWRRTDCSTQIGNDKRRISVFSDANKVCTRILLFCWVYVSELSCWSQWGKGDSSLHISKRNTFWSQREMWFVKRLLFTQKKADLASVGFPSSPLLKATHGLHYIMLGHFCGCGPTFYGEKKCGL